ncbi:hypothetical protein UCRPA7_4546 [Phaeoacremonium minimum UCRPA7]|uniref:Uncharacterized protein n=1 Tax=Phaeoacremonium minimum (strain UCR-PA7) TaxID=1286976 RepID=R8BKP7_PHAM7|nr:hypothetical protein UCRPA7_4546 [Phaeoacremonium minimum UCRPA7]EON99938.1 hypothetical protein UCRPA7_4546 [Phaeoacremonium minimum UCRPA7]
MLSEDIVLNIFDFVQAASPRSAADLALVHPRFYRQARYVQHRRVAIDLDNKHEVAAKRLNLIEKDEGFLPAIHELRVLSRYGKPDAQCLQRLAAMVPGMTGLRSVHWEYTPIPAALLESLTRLPFPVRLHVVVRDKKSRDPAARQLLARLTGCGVLASVTLEAAYLGAADCLELSRPLKQLLLTSPNLVDLSLDLHLPRQGCVGYAAPVEYPGLGFSSSERPLRPLESLTIHEYPWGEEEVQGRFAFHSQGYPGTGHEIDYWAANFNWSTLKRLEVTSPSTQVLFAITLAPMLTALREVRFTSARDSRGNSLETFFNSVPSILEDISVPSLDSIGVVALARHAPSLRRLTVHQPEASSASAWEEHLLPEGALGELHKKAPHLEELGLDMLRVGGDWPRGQLDALARFCHLRVLELWFGFGDWKFSGPPQPALTASAAAQLFTDLRHSIPTLQRLRVHSGCPPPPGIGMLADSAFYPEDNSASFDCRIPERDDDAAAGEVAVTSFRLSPRLNARMQRILKGIEKREDVQGNLIALQVALDGPMQYADWGRWRKEWPIPNFPALMDAAEGRNQDNNSTSRGRLYRLLRR